MFRQVVLVNHDEDPNLLALDEAAVDAIANSIASHRSDGQRAGIQVNLAKQHVQPLRLNQFPTSISRQCK